MKDTIELEKRIREIHSIKKQMGFLSHAEIPLEGKVDIDLERLALLIDPTTTARLYSKKKYIGPFLTWMRTSLVKILYFLFRLDFSRVIELHQNVWIMAYQLKNMQARMQVLETELKDLKSTHDKKTV